MHNKLFQMSLFGFAFLVGLLPVSALQLNLADHLINVDGGVIPPNAEPAGTSLDDSGFDYSTGLGTVTISISSAGAHFVGLYLDHEMDQALNTFFNEYAQAVNTPAAGESWEIDEPGYSFGNIFSHIESSTTATS